ncbi:MAG: HAD hydrolase-like protein [Pseudanabaenales cyanobacterium]|nr:HAD hydrolase-like protein [Pseudanabaenales cyanobacterium]
MKHPTIVAFDFDGVICDGLIEYFQTAWRAYCQIFALSDATPPNGLAERFYPLRPVVETGWEMPILLKALLAGVKDEVILQDWQTIAQQFLVEQELEAAKVGAAVDGVRDEWIQADLQNWLDQHRFYPGVIERLKALVSSSTYPVIVTTKEGRFVRQLLNQQGVELADEQIFGKEVKQPKHQTLRQLIQQQQHQGEKSVHLWFIEDRLKTLQRVKQESALGSVQLFLGDWGYNTETDRQIARHDSRIHLLSLTKLVQEFSAWI